MFLSRGSAGSREIALWISVGEQLVTNQIFDKEELKLKAITKSSQVRHCDDNSREKLDSREKLESWNMRIWELGQTV